MSEALVVVAHPQIEHSRVARRLMQRAARTGPEVRVHDLYALYPDYYIDVAAEQAALAASRLLVWVHPVHWYGMPPLLRLWLDEVFAFGWAYGPGGHALRGKGLWLVTSTGGAAGSYSPLGHNRHRFEDFLPPYEQTAALVGMRWLPPQVLHGAHRASEAALTAFEDHFAERLDAAMRAPTAAETAAGEPAPVPADARPSRPGSPG